MRKHLLLGAWLSFVSLGCESQATLIVQVRTDLLPGSELSAIEVSVDGEGAVESFAATDARDWGIGVRVFEQARSPGEVRLRVAARGAMGALLVERPVRVDLESGVYVVTVLLTRDCLGVTCPDAAAPTALACLGGRCVEETCVEESSVGCGAPECTVREDCAPVAGSCVTAECTSTGICFDAPDHSACMASEVCSSEGECVSSACEEWVLAFPELGPVASAVAPSISRTSDALLLAWNTPSGGAESTRLEVDGSVGAAVPLSSSAIDTVLAAHPGGAVASWRSLSDRLDVQLLDENGAPSAPGGALTGISVAGPHHFAWSGERLGIAWIDGRAGGMDAFFTATDLAGAGGREVRLIGGLTGAPRVAWTGTDFVVVYADAAGANQIIQAARFDAEGALLNAGVAVDISSDASAASIAWNGSDLGLVFSDQADGRVLFTSLGAGFTRTEEVPVGLGADLFVGDPQLVWDGDGYAILWVDVSGVMHLARIDRVGVPLMRTLDIAAPPSTSQVSFIAAHGGYFVTFIAGTPPGHELHVARLCPG